MGKKIQIITKKPNGRDLQEWVSWLLAQEASHSPALDNTGQRAARNQGRYNVWFIPGTTHNPEKINRNSTVPANTPMLMMAATSDASYAEFPDAQNDSHLLQIARGIAALHTDVKIKIIDKESGESDEFTVQDAKKPIPGELELIETDVFPFIFPEDNIYERFYHVNGGYTHLACVGWGIEVALQPGKYTLILKAKHAATQLSIGGLQINPPVFNLDIEYELTAIGGTNKFPSNLYPD